ncbi:chondroitin sulfate proteoglycan 4-like [Globicephala melas]|uniref:chondroitin sulfate proteoglycan 4-like n=1 Tax=Globicephala melas TaxID=9731 RepID=UPI00293D50AD|nr:chondroitin sulfate proteoglycan 4-like [Globicephala melas]XP_060151758.1 chondroitin sulfate proteoglycan 4-like [Globicephala melas]
MNGFQAVSRLEILVDIVPKWIPLAVQNVTVQEGGSKALPEDYFKIPSKHFEGLDCEFVLLKPPKHGYVENSHFPRVKLMKFTRKQVENELISYVHDDSEDLLDNFTIFANSSELGKQSLPQTLSVTVESVNDEAPVITTNKILQVWVNSVTEITSGELCAEDGDSSPQDLAYLVSPPSNGHLALKSFPGLSMQNFTQAQISEGQLVFVHTGAMSGRFNFQVTDGLNFTPQQMFSITARALIISLEVNRGLSISPGAVVKEGDKVLIGQSKSDASNLLLKLPKPQCSSYETWFQVTSLPHRGTIMVGERNITKSKPSFSQYVINKLGITYLHDDSESLADNFTFAVWPNQKSKSTTKPEADFLEEMFHITITPINDKAQELRTKGFG